MITASNDLNTSFLLHVHLMCFIKPETAMYEVVSMIIKCTHQNAAAIVVFTEIVRTQNALYTGHFEAIEVVSPVTKHMVFLGAHM